MSWFDRHAGDDPEAFVERLCAVAEAAGVEAAVLAAAGPIGLRRFVVRAEVREGRVRVVGVEGPPLPKGGGPPNPSAWAAGVGVVESSLARFRRGLPRGSEFSEVAVGCLRHADGRVTLGFRFDEEAPALRAAELDAPDGESSPSEDPAYLRALAAWSVRVDEVRGRYGVARGDWTLSAGMLDDGTRRTAATPIATWHAGQRRFEWCLEDPVGEEAPFVEPEFIVDLAGAVEIVCFATARMGGVGVFQGTLPTGVTVFVALRNG